MRKNLRNIAKCKEQSYVYCRTKCIKRAATETTPKCEFLKRSPNRPKEIENPIAA